MNALLRPAGVDLRYAWLGDVYVDFTANELRVGGRDVRLTPKSCAVLRELALRDNHVVRRDDLLGLVWRDGFPTDDVLTRAIKELRRAFDDDPRAPTLIETIPRVGYRLRMTVRALDAPALALAASIDAAALDTPGNDAPDEADAVSVQIAPTPAATLDDDASSAAARIDDSAPVDAPRRTTLRRLRSRRLISIVAIVATFGVVAVAVAAIRRESVVAFTPATTPIAPLLITADPGSEYFPALSPDGGLVAYVGAAYGEYDAAILLKGRDPAARAQVLVPVSAGHFMAHLNWSPDGTQIAFADVGDGRCEVRIVPVTGGTPRTVGTCSAPVLDGFDWSADGEHLYLSEASAGEPEGTRAIARLSLADGTTERVDYAPRGAGDVDLFPRVSPDGQWLAFRRGMKPYADVWLMPIAGGRARPVARLGSLLRGMAWTADSRSLIVSSDHAGQQSLYRIEIADGRVTALGIDNAHYPAVSRNAGYVTYEQQQELTQIVAFDLDANGRAGDGRLVSPTSRPDHTMNLSASGRRVAFISERSGTPQVWVHDLDRDEATMVSEEIATTPDLPMWSPDERTVIHVSRGRGSSRLMQVDLASRRRVVLGSPDERIRYGSYASDGRSIFYSSDRHGPWQIWRMNTDGGDAHPVGDVEGLDPRQFAGDPHVYYSKPTVIGVFRVDPATGREEKITDLASYATRGSYSVQGGRLWLYERLSADLAHLVTRPLAGGVGADGDVSEITALRFPGANPWFSTSFNTAHTRVVTNMVMRDGTDVLVAELPPR